MAYAEIVNFTNTNEHDKYGDHCGKDCDCAPRALDSEAAVEEEAVSCLFDPEDRMKGFDAAVGKAEKDYLREVPGGVHGDGGPDIFAVADDEREHDAGSEGSDPPGSCTFS